MEKPNGWDNWGNHILEELKRLNSNIEKLADQSHAFESWTKAEIAALQVKCGVWGVIGGGSAMLLVYLAEKMGS